MREIEMLIKELRKAKLHSDAITRKKLCQNIIFQIKKKLALKRKSSYSKIFKAIIYGGRK